MTDIVFARAGTESVAESHWSGMLPLGIGYLAAATRRAGYKTAVVDGRRLGHISIQETAAAITAHRPRIVGLTCLTADFPRTQLLAAILKHGSEPPVVVLGGAHVNALPVRSLEDTPAADYVIAGESEDSCLHLLSDISNGVTPGEIPGLFSRSANGSVKQHAPPGYNTDVSTLPFPAWDLFPPATVYPILTERGCPYSCVFCSRNMSHRVRSRSIDHIMGEIRWLAEDHQANAIDFEDETFGLKADRTFDLLDRLAAFNQKKRMTFKAQTRTDRVTPQLAREMYKAGFRYVELGVESGDQSVLDASSKGTQVKQAEVAVNLLRAAGIKTWINFVIGLPGESRDSVRRSIALAAKLNPDRLSVAIIVAYPGCDVYDWAIEGQHGYRLLSHDWKHFDKYLSPSVELDGLPYKTMRRLQIRMYAETYLRNFRFGDLARLVWKHRSFLTPALKTSFSMQNSGSIEP